MVFHPTQSSHVSTPSGYLMTCSKVYVDDFCIISDSQDEVDKLKAYLAPLGDSSKWLSLTINHDVLADTLSISKWKL